VVLRFPFTFTTATVRVLLLLPHLPALQRQHDRLQAALIDREREIAKLRESLRQALQEQAIRQVVSATNGVTADVIGRSLIPTQHTVVLDRGERHGLSLDSVIMDAHGVIGRVAELQPVTCLVMLLTDPDSRIAGLVERSREAGLLVGSGAGQCSFVYLDADADIQAGDRIVTAGLGGPFSKGLPLGTVTRVFRDEQAGTTSASVLPAARPGRLEHVLCLPPSR